MVSIILGHRGVEKIEVPCDGRLELHATTLLLSAPEITALHEKCRSRSDALWAAVEADED
jgi:hypothetical protein